MTWPQSRSLSGVSSGVTEESAHGRARCAQLLLQRLRWASLAWPPALTAIAAGRFRLSGARSPAQQSAQPDEPQTQPSGPGRGINAEHDDVGLRFGCLPSLGQGFEVRRQGAPDAPLRGAGRVGGGIDSRQTRYPGAERPVRLTFDDNRIVLGHSPASFRILAVSPVPTSFLVCTAIVMTCPVFEWTSCRWLPLPVLASTNPAAFNRRTSSPHVTHSV